MIKGNGGTVQRLSLKRVQLEFEEGSNAKPETRLQCDGGA